MKSWMWVLIAGVMVIVIGALFMLRPTSVVAPETSIEATPLASDNGGGFVQMAPEEMTPSVSPTSTKKASTTISITDTGFSPATVTIGVGDTVTFVNNGQATHWPGSDPHPVHDGHPDFDAKRGLETGETYSFTFTKAGSWPFHDHLYPALKGTVVVK